MSAFSVRQAGRIATAQLLFVAFAGGCAEGTQQGSLNSDTLVEGSTAGSMAAGGSSAGADASGGMPTAGDTALPAAGSSTAGTTSTVGGGGSTTLGGSAGSGGAAAAGSGGVGGSLAGAGGVGGTAGSGGGVGGVGGSAPAGFRYVKLVATSEQKGAVWSSVAELQVFTTGDVQLTRGDWVASADSQETDDETDPAGAAIDGDVASFWHTAWEPAPDDVNDAKLPHWLVVDLGSPHPVTGFSYLPRQTGANGHIKDWEFYVSKDGKSWGTALKTGSFADGTTLQKITF